MRNLALASILAVTVLAVSGCSTKSNCGACAPSYPTCVVKPACGCK